MPAGLFCILYLIFIPNLEPSPNNALNCFTSAAFDIIKKCVREVHDGDNIMNRSDFSDKELDTFFDSFNTGQFESVMEFFNSMPKLRHVLTVKNSKTGVDNEITLEGLDSFF